MRVAGLLFAASLLGGCGSTPARVANAVGGERSQVATGAQPSVRLSRFSYFGRVVQVDRAERLVIVQSDEAVQITGEVFTRDSSLQPTARLALLPAARAGVYAATIREGTPNVGDEVVLAGPER